MLGRRWCIVGRDEVHRGAEPPFLDAEVCTTRRSSWPFLKFAGLVASGHRRTRLTASGRQLVI